MSSAKENHDLHAQEQDFQVGQSVMVSNMGAGPRLIPGTNMSSYILDWCVSWQNMEVTY